MFNLGYRVINRGAYAILIPAKAISSQPESGGAECKEAQGELHPAADVSEITPK